MWILSCMLRASILAWRGFLVGSFLWGAFCGKVSVRELFWFEGGGGVLVLGEGVYVRIFQ